MTRAKRTPSEDFELGYQAGLAARTKLGQATIQVELDRLRAEILLLQARLKEATARAEAAEKAAAKAAGTKGAKAKPKPAAA